MPVDEMKDAVAKIFRALPPMRRCCPVLYGGRCKLVLAWTHARGA